MIRIGLRFDRKDAAYLRAVARQVRSGQRRADSVSGLEFAADAAETGEPLILQCESPNEAKRMAAQFVRLGCTLPTIDELTGQRPAK